jgi:GNAT superfamily N-acetyltransferase
MITYRTANLTDAEQLLRTRRTTVVNNRAGIYSDEILHAWAPEITEERIAAEAKALENPNRVTVLAEDVICEQDNPHTISQIIALCTVDVSKGLLQQCYVLPQYNGLGIAGELVKRVETIAKEYGLRSLQLSSSLIALEFYTKQGYTKLNSYLYDLDNGLHMPCVMMEKVFDL